jgi:hypothetical protein
MQDSNDKIFNFSFDSDFIAFEFETTIRQANT